MVFKREYSSLFLAIEMMKFQGEGFSLEESYESRMC